MSEVFGIGRFTETEGRIVGAVGWGRDEWEVTA